MSKQNSAWGVDLVTGGWVGALFISTKPSKVACTTMPGSKITRVSLLSLFRVFISLLRPPQRRTLSYSTLSYRASEFLVGPGWCCPVSKSTKHQVSRARGLQMKVPSRHNHHPPPALSCICSPTTSPPSSFAAPAQRRCFVPVAYQSSAGPPVWQSICPTHRSCGLTLL